MSATRDEFVDYSCRRTDMPDPARYRYRAFGEARETDPASLEFFLVERYYLYAVRTGSLVRAQVSHRPYQLREADVQASSATPARWDGFTEISDSPVHICFEDGVDVNVYATEKL
jgi:uncharacterized protein YqjF (DUF2071 family)